MMPTARSPEQDASVVDRDGRRRVRRSTTGTTFRGEVVRGRLACFVILMGGALATAPAAFADSAAAARSGDVLLLDFAASWCGPCRQMAPLVDEIARAGWVVRHVDVDREHDLVRRFGVTGVPCYVLLVKGHEVGRIDGAATRGDLARLLAKSGPPLGSTPPDGGAPDPVAGGPEQPMPGIPLPTTAAAAPLSTDPVSRPTAIEPAAPRPPEAAATAAFVTPSPSGRTRPPDPAATDGHPARADLERRVLGATARLKVEDAGGVSWGTGTVIDCRQGEALILTCGHIFRDSAGKGRVEVDLFGPRGPRGVAGQVVSWDLKRDLALVSIFTDAPLEAVRVGGADCSTPVGAAVVTVGCNGGADPTIHRSRITAVDKYLGPANLQVAGQPVQGRSGGGLFAIDGTLIGVCNAADPADNEGLFAALPAIHEQLEESGLAFVYRNVYPSAGIDALAAAGVGGSAHVPAMPAEMPSFSLDRRDRAAAVPTASTAGPGATPAGVAPAAVPVPLPVPPTAAAPGETVPAALSSGERALIDHVRQHDGRAEVICIVRPHGTPDAESEVFVLKGAGGGFVEQLARAHQRQPETPPRSDLAVLPTANTTR